MLTATYGLVANSASLLTDSLDDLGDAITYALSLYVVYKSDKAKAKVALFKGKRLVSLLVSQPDIVLDLIRLRE